MQELSRLKDIKCFLFDMDGTINLGEQLIPGMEGFFQRLTQAGRRFYLLTNNSSRSHAPYVAKMSRLGVPVTEQEVLISSDALCDYLAEHCPASRLYVLGTPQLEELLERAGFQLVKQPRLQPLVASPARQQEEVDLIVLGFDQCLTYERLSTACRLIDRGVPYIATHPDRRCPIEGGEFIPDTGAMIALLETATGRKPSLILGKPYASMVDAVLRRTGYSKEQVAMVGDRLATDIAFGRRNGILSILVLTGEASLADVQAAREAQLWEQVPDLILEGAYEILRYL